MTVSVENFFSNHNKYPETGWHIIVSCLHFNGLNSVSCVMSTKKLTPQSSVTLVKIYSNFVEHNTKQ